MNGREKIVASWLLVCCALVFALVVLGGVTRLTRSGLSIVEWQPVTGIVPPLTEQQWEEAFAAYRATPEYRLVNRGMSLAEFQRIYWIEYFHRLLARLVGLAFLLPLAYFLARRWVDARLALRLAGIFALGALQGALGWYMVASGLVDEPRVSHFRLTAHLGLAFLIYGAMLWVALGLLAPHPAAGGASAGLRRLAWTVTALVGAMVVTGGFVAGTRAGYAYNTFPLMNGQLVPPELFALEPWYENFFSNLATVQFNHRLFAWALALAVPVLWVRAVRGAAPPRVRALAHALLFAFAAQVALGISTLLLAVPVALGAAHQAGALVVFTVSLALAHALRAPRQESAAALRLART